MTQAGDVSPIRIATWWHCIFIRSTGWYSIITTFTPLMQIWTYTRCEKPSTGASHQSPMLYWLHKDKIKWSYINKLSWDWNFAILDFDCQFLEEKLFEKCCDPSIEKWYIFFYDHISLYFLTFNNCNYHTILLDGATPLRLMLPFFSSSLLLQLLLLQMRWERVISFSSALTSAKRFGRIENWRQRDLDPQPSEFIQVYKPTGPWCPANVNWMFSILEIKFFYDIAWFTQNLACCII